MGRETGIHHQDHQVQILWLKILDLSDCVISGIEIVVHHKNDIVVLTKAFLCHISCRAMCKFYSYIQQSFIMATVLGCAVAT